MSVTTSRLPLARAEVYAERLREVLAAACEDVLVVGSVRRRKVDVGDIELAVLPKFDEVPKDLFGGVVEGKRGPGYSQLDRVIGGLVEAGLLVVDPACQGPRQKRFRLGPGGIVWAHAGFTVELYIAQGLGNWGNTVAIRTGPKEWNIALVTSWQRGGLMPSMLCHKDGWLRWCGPGTSTTFQCPTEQHFFRHLKLPYVPPHKRTAELVEVLRSGRYDVDELEAE